MSTAKLTWLPIDTAPTDNLRPLMLARFDKSGVLKELDFDGQIDDVVSANVISEMKEVYWCNIDQKWEESL